MKEKKRKTKEEASVKNDRGFSLSQINFKRLR